MRALRRSQQASPISAGTPAFEAVPAPHGGQTTPGGTPLTLRLKVFVTRRGLDRQIAAGRACESSPALSLRARQLTGWRSRQELARNLRRVVDYVERRRSPGVISTVMIEPAAVRAGRQAILGLARRLEGPAPVSASGVVLSAALLTDGRSPLFNPHSKRTVAQAVSEVHDALEGLPILEFDALAA
jgi:hypothetical protein